MIVSESRDQRSSCLLGAVAVVRFGASSSSKCRGRGPLSFTAGKREILQLHHPPIADPLPSSHPVRKRQQVKSAGETPPPGADHHALLINVYFALLPSFFVIFSSTTSVQERQAGVAFHCLHAQVANRTASHLQISSPAVAHSSPGFVRDQSSKHHVASRNISASVERLQRKKDTRNGHR